MPRWDETLSTRPDRMKRLVRFESERAIARVVPADVAHGGESLSLKVLLDPRDEFASDVSLCSG
jgi:hypothetical protein